MFLVTFADQKRVTTVVVDVFADPASVREKARELLEGEM
jgi:hypothetical protein